MRGTTLNTKIHPTQPRGGHPSHSNLVRGKLTSPTPNPAGDGTSGLTSYPRRRSKVSEATCLRPQRSAPSRTRTRAVRPRVQRSDHWATHASLISMTLRRALKKLVHEWFMKINGGNGFLFSCSRILRCVKRINKKPNRVPR